MDTLVPILGLATVVVLVILALVSRRGDLSGDADGGSSRDSAWLPEPDVGADDGGGPGGGD